MNGKMIEELRSMAESNDREVSQKAMTRFILSGLADVLEISSHNSDKIEKQGEVITKVNERIKDIDARVAEIQRTTEEEVQEQRDALDARIAAIDEKMEKNIFLSAGSFFARNPKTGLAILIVFFLVIDVIGSELLPLLGVPGGIVDIISRLGQ